MEKGFVGNALPSQGIRLDWSQAAFVVVSGSQTNPCGHALLYVGGGFGHYFHVPGIPRWYERPFYISGPDFPRYLSTSGKREIGRKKLNIPCPAQAEAKLRALMEAKWAYGVLPQNCVSFVQEVAKAGGNKWDFNNWPQLEPLRFKWLEEKVAPLFRVSPEQCAVMK